jgi:hypothetical protein
MLYIWTYLIQLTMPSPSLWFKILLLYPIHIYIILISTKISMFKASIKLKMNVCCIQNVVNELKLFPETFISIYQRHLMICSSL